MNKCLSCDSLNTDEAVFCSKCGCSISSVKPKAIPSIYTKAGTYAVAAVAGSTILTSYMQSSLKGVDSNVKLGLLLVPGIILLSAFPAAIISIRGFAISRKKNLLVKGIIGVVIPLLYIALVFAGLNKSRNNEDIGYFVNQLNIQTPKMIDEITRLDKISLDSGNVVSVNMTIISYNSNEIDKRSLDSLLIPQNKKQLQISSMFMLVKSGYAVAYRYFGKDSILITTQKFTAKDFEIK